MKKKVEATKSKYAGMRGGYKGGGRKKIEPRELRKIHNVGLNANEYNIIKTAAGLVGNMPFQAFVRDSALEKARKIIVSDED